MIKLRFESLRVGMLGLAKMRSRHACTTALILGAEYLRIAQCPSASVSIAFTIIKNSAGTAGFEPVPGRPGRDSVSRLTHWAMTML